jgi:hypothetical protein
MVSVELVVVWVTVLFRQLGLPGGPEEIKKTNLLQEITGTRYETEQLQLSGRRPIPVRHNLSSYEVSVW